MTGDSGEAIPKMDPPQIFLERTLAIVKPDAVLKSDEIEDIILRSGFTILQVGLSCPNLSDHQSTAVLTVTDWKNGLVL